MNIHEIRTIVTEILEELIEIYELPPIPINDNLLLIETLGFTSVDVMHMLASVDMRLQRHLPYDDMVIKNGTYVQDLSVGEIVRFIHANQDQELAEPRQMS